MKKCIYCGFENSKEASFCGGCGKPLKKIQLKNECPLCHIKSDALATPVLRCTVVMHCVINEKDIYFFGEPRYFAPNNWDSMEGIVKIVYSEDIESYERSDYKDILGAIGFKDWYVDVSYCDLRSSDQDYRYMDYSIGKRIDFIKINSNKGISEEDDIECVSLGDDSFPPENQLTNLDFKSVIDLALSSDFLANYQIPDELDDYADKLDIDTEEVPSILKILLYSNLY